MSKVMVSKESFMLVNAWRSQQVSCLHKLVEDNREMIRKQFKLVCPPDCIGTRITKAGERGASTPRSHTKLGERGVSTPRSTKAEPRR